MRLSGTDLVPLLTIVAGGVIGASLSFSLLRSPSDDVRAARPVVALSTSAAPGLITDILRRCQMERLATDVEQVRVVAEHLAREQRDVEAEVARLAGEGNGSSSEAERRLFDRKEAMVEEMDDLKVELQRLTNNARAYRRTASDLLFDATRTIEELRDRVRFSQSRDTEDSSRQFEAETTPLFDQLYEEVLRARYAVVVENRAVAAGDLELLAAFDRATGQRCRLLLGETPVSPGIPLVF